MQRRDFLITGLAAGSLARAQKRVPLDPLVTEPAVQWAASELQRALEESNLTNIRVGVKQIPGAPESFSLSRAGSVITAGGADARGAVYALLELADRVRHSPNPACLADQTAGLRDAPQSRPQHLAHVRQRRGGQALVQRPRDVARLSHHAGRAALQPLQPRPRHRLRFPARRHRRLFPISLSVPARRARLQRARHRTCPMPSATAIWKRCKFISEQTVARGLDFQLGLWMHGYQWVNSPQGQLHDRRPHAGNARPVLPRRAHCAAEGLPRHHRRHLPHPRRKRRGRGQLRFLEDGVRGRARMRPQGRNRHARQGHRPGHDRCRARHRHARHGVAEILGRAHGHAVSSGRHPRPGDAARRDRYRLDGAEHRLAQFHALRLWPICCAKTAATMCCIASGRARSACCCGATRSGRRLLARLHVLRQSTASRSIEPLSFKGRRGSGIAGGRCGYADASSEAALGLGEVSLLPTACGADCSTIPQADPDGWQRALHRSSPRTALAQSPAASCPIITTAHMPSAANNNYWPEMYTNQPIVDARKESVQRHARAESVRQRQPARPATLLAHQRFRRRVAQGRAQRQVFAHRSGAVAGRPAPNPPGRCSPVLPRPPARTRRSTSSDSRTT